MSIKPGRVATALGAAWLLAGSGPAHAVLALDAVPVQYANDFVGETGFPTSTPSSTGFVALGADAVATASIEPTAGIASVSVPSANVGPPSPHAFEQGFIAVDGQGVSGATGGFRTTYEAFTPSIVGIGFVQVQSCLVASGLGTHGYVMGASLDYAPGTMNLQLFEVDLGTGAQTASSIVPVDTTRRAEILLGVPFELEIAIDGGTGVATAGLRVAGISGEVQTSVAPATFTDFGSADQARAAGLAWSYLTFAGNTSAGGDDLLEFDVSRIEVRASPQPVDLLSITATAGERRTVGGGYEGVREAFQVNRAYGWHSGQIASAVVLTPSGASLPVTKFSDGVWRLDTGNFASFGNMATVLGFGTYDIQISLADGTTDVKSFPLAPLSVADPGFAVITSPTAGTSGLPDTPTIAWTLGCSAGPGNCATPDGYNQVAVATWSGATQEVGQVQLGNPSSWTVPTALPDPSVVEAFIEPAKIAINDPAAVTTPPDTYGLITARLNTTGTLFFVPEPATTLGLGAGSLLLALLARTRCRERGQRRAVDGSGPRPPFRRRSQPA